MQGARLPQSARQRTDSTHVLGALRLLSKWERTAETLRAALNALASADAEWLTKHADPEWVERYGSRIEDQRLPKGKEASEEYLRTVGADGIRLLGHLDAPSRPPRHRSHRPGIQGQHLAGKGLQRLRRGTLPHRLGRQGGKLSAGTPSLPSFTALVRASRGPFRREFEPSGYARLATEA